MTDSIHLLLRDLRLGLESLYRERLAGLYLYGSFARGEEKNGSDVDILIVLDDFDSYGSEIDLTSELVSGVSLKHGISVSRVFVSKRQWEGSEGPFLSNLREESVPA